MPGAYPEWDMAPMQAAYTLHRLWEAPDRQAFIAEHAPHIRAVATRGELGANAELIASLPKLELIACYGVGTDGIDLAACRARGIRVSNTPDVLNGDVADLAVGLTLALQCQLRVMADTAWIGDTHTKIGRLGSCHNLYAALPRTTAAYLTLCNGRLTAQECYAQAIVNKIVPGDKLMAAAEELAQMICESSPLAVQAAVRLYRLTAAFPQSLVAYARELDQQTAESEDGAEGSRAFKEKRKPVWKLR